MTLSELVKNQPASISYLPENIDLCSKLIEQGFSLKTVISLAHRAPFNGPIAFNLHGTKMVLPRDIAAQIKVELVS